MIYDHAPYYFARKMATLPRKSSLHCNVEAIAKGYHTYQSVWVAVGNKLSCQRELRRSICSYCDKRRVDRSVGHFPKKIPQFARCFYDKVGSVLCLWIWRSMAMCLAFSIRQAKIFREETFAEQIFATWYSIAKITKISALRKFPAIR